MICDWLGTWGAVLFGCALQVPAAQFSHPTLGIVDDTHPAYRTAHEKCDAAVYGVGVTLGGVTYTTKDQVWDEAIAPVAPKMVKTETETAMLQDWALIQSNFIACVESEGFTFYRP